MPPVDYDSQDEVHLVGWNGELRFRDKRYKVSNALHRHRVGIRARHEQDGCFGVFFAHHHCLTIDLHKPSDV